MTRYSNDRRNAAGAIPVYIVAQPAVDPTPPNVQNNAAGAIPVNMVAAPTMPNSGAIPVRVVGGPGPGPKWPSDQGLDAGAIPVYTSVSPKAMLVWNTSAAHSSQALAYLARTVGGNEGGNGANIAILIDGLVADGVWPLLDCLYVLAQQNVTDARLNLIGATFTLPTGPTFTAYRGLSAFPSPGLDTGFNATTAPSPHFVQNSASLGAWAYDTPDAGCQIGTDNIVGGSLLQVNYTDGFMYVDINNAVGDVVLTAPATNGWYSAERTSSTNINIYFNNTNKGAFTHASAAPDNHDMFIGGLFSGGLNVTAKTISAACWGASLGPTLQLALYNRLRTYMTAIGVP